MSTVAPNRRAAPRWSGHSIAAEPEVRHNRIGIDTGAYKTGVLTCLVLDGPERSFLQTG